MFFSQLAQIYWTGDEVEPYDEFGNEVFQSHERELQRISRGNSQWRAAKRMLSQHGWADMSYFLKKQHYRIFHCTYLIEP